VGLGYQRQQYMCGNGLAPHMGGVRGRFRAGPATEKKTHDDFFYFKSFFQLNKSAGDSKIGEILGNLRKMSNFAWRQI
jgi:hypothetical protein